MVILLGVLGVFLSMESRFYAITLISFFAAVSSFVILFLFIIRANCMSKMLNGTELLASWVYSEEDTIRNIVEAKEENKGLWFMAMVSLSMIAVIVLITVGIAADFFAIGLLISLMIIAMNVLILKLYMRMDDGMKDDKHIDLKQNNNKKRYVFISNSGIYAHGQLHVWKGWGSNLKEVYYHLNSGKLSFTYSYLRPYGFGLYTVTVKVPQNKDYLYHIKKGLLVDSRIINNL